MSRNWINSNPLTLVIFVLLIAALSCTLVTETTVTDEDRLVREERPALVLLAPINGNTYAAGTEVTLHAIATDIGGNISRIEFIIDLPGEELLLVYPSDNPEGDSTLEAIVTWEAFGNQTYIIHARAYRPSGDPNDPVDDVPSNEGITSITVVDPNSSGGELVTPSVDETPEVIDDPTPTEDPTDTEVGGVDINSLPVIVATINSTAPIRQGPDVVYAVIQNNLAAETLIEVIGRSEDLFWFAFRFENGVAWVYRDFVDFPGSVNDLPVIEAPER